jgi:hypothetical protein
MKKVPFTQSGWKNKIDKKRLEEESIPQPLFWFYFQLDLAYELEGLLATDHQKNPSLASS